MANGATFTQSSVFKNKWAGLLTMTLAAAFIQARHCQPTGWFENVAAVGIVALRAIHFFLQDRMMLGQMKLSFLRVMAFKARGRILARIHNEFAASAACRDVQAPRSVAGFTSSLASGARVLEANAHMGASRKDAADIGVTFSASFISDECRTRYIRSGSQFERSGGTGIENQSHHAREA